MSLEADFIKIRNHILEASILTDNAFMAADVDMNGKITGSDFIKVRNHILNTNHLS